MNREEIMAAIHDLAKSKGFYGRIEEALTEAKTKCPEFYEQAMTHLEAQNFKDIVDLILYLES